ncbi:hypothetical protein D9615_007620 [Tricholomella constricta]|uniref:DUF6533 domain-containing protein n=1 Tax=Tricholomella constricta TaxID=117010 RepID=A0A8H5H7K7_9AGAR|nr:hypothetical protein D9615_007620 [Tricholomella constricta]
MTSTALQLLDQNLVQGTLLASGTVLIYDLLCTLDQEVAYVWSNPWSISSLLFFLNRYLPFVDTFLSLNLKFSRNTPEKCLSHFTAVTWLIVIGTLISEAILMLRTYAIWERKRSIFVILCLLALFVFPPAMIITFLEVKSLKYGPTSLRGCQLVHASPLILVAYILLVVSETTLAVLTAIKAYRHLRHSQSRWVVQLYQDGIVFYFFLLGISLANIIVPIAAPPILANWLATPQRVIHSVLCTRVLFLILRQRSGTSMTNRLSGGLDSQTSPVFTSFMENDTTMDMTIMGPTNSALSTSAYSLDNTSDNNR